MSYRNTISYNVLNQLSSIHDAFMLHSCSKKLGVSGAVSDQSIEHLNDVPAASAVNFRGGVFDLKCFFLIKFAKCKISLLYLNEKIHTPTFCSLVGRGGALEQIR